MKHPLRLLLVCFALAGAVASAGVAHAQTSFGPQQGSRELRIGTTLVGPLRLADGFSVFDPSKGDSTTFVALGAGFGYFLTDLVEVGASAQFVSMSDGGPKGPGIAPFARLYGRSGRVGMYAGVDASFVYFSLNSGHETITGVGGEAGLEFFVTPDWAVRVAPSFHHYGASVSRDSSFGGGTSTSDDSGNAFGVGWGLAAYF